MTVITLRFDSDHSRPVPGYHLPIPCAQVGDVAYPAPHAPSLVCSYLALCTSPHGH